MKPNIIFLALAVIVSASCKNEVEMLPNNISAEMTISGLGDEYWTYFSFAKGETVGCSDYCDAEQDALWAERSDWDFAICGNKIKTNSGDSGKGMGGVQRNTSDSFSTLEFAPSDGYLTDITVRADGSK